MICEEAEGEAGKERVQIIVRRAFGIGKSLQQCQPRLWRGRGAQFASLYNDGRRAWYGSQAQGRQKA